VQIDTTRFGAMEIEEQLLLHFPKGLLGFPERRDYIIFDHDREVPFKWLQAVDDPELAFVIMDPCLFAPNYRLDVQPQDLQELRVNDLGDLIVFVLVTIPPSDPAQMTANLQGPVLVNAENRWAKQLVLSNSLYHTRHPLCVAVAATPVAS
jgi:flagellar assembly factor FliW